MNTDSQNLSAHLSESDIAAYIDGELVEAERRRIEGHMTHCDECRQEMIASRAAVSSAPMMSRRPKWLNLGIGMAVAAGLMVVAATTLTRSAGDRTAIRGGTETSGAIPAISVIAPAEGAVLPAGRQLVWRKVAEDASYRVTIGDDTGQPIHSIAVQDTSVAIPSTVILAGGQKYFWYVDAILPDGRTATSGLKAFTVK